MIHSKLGSANFKSVCLWKGNKIWWYYIWNAIAESSEHWTLNTEHWTAITAIAAMPMWIAMKYIYFYLTFTIS